MTNKLALVKKNKKEQSLNQRPGITCNNCSYMIGYDCGTALNNSDNFPTYPRENHHCSDV